MTAATRYGAIAAKNKHRGNTPINVNIDSVTASFTHNQYTDRPIQINCIPSPFLAVKKWRVELRDSVTGNIIGLKFEQNPIFSAPAADYIGFVDVAITAYNDTDSYDQYYEEAIFIDLPRFTKAECDILIDSSTFFQDFGSIARPGLKIGITGTINGYVQLHNLWGTLASYARVQAFDDPVINVPGGVFHGIRVDGDNRYIRFNLFNEDGTQGLTVNGHATNSAQTVMNNGVFTNIEYHGLRTNHNHTIVFAGAALSFIPNTDNTINATTWVIQKPVVFGCYFNNANEEAIYAGYNNDNAISGNRPAKLRDGIFCWNTIINSGRDGIQPGGCVNVRVHHNTILGWGIMKHAGHESAISWNGGNYGLCYNNYCIGGKMFINFQSGNCPWDIQAGQTSPQPSTFFCNVFYNGIYDPVGGGAEPFVCYGQTSPSSGSGVMNYRFFNNSFYADKKFMEMYYHTASFTSDNFRVENNIIVKVGNAGVTPEVNFTKGSGGGVIPTVGQYTTNNLVREVGTEADVKFISKVGNNFRLLDFTSTAYTFGTPANVASLYAEIAAKRTRDADGLKLLAPGQRYTFGAYSGWQNRTIPFVPSDNNPASFTITPAITAITEKGGTLSFQANKVGVLYYTFALQASPPPTALQLQNQSYGLFPGSLVDIGSGATKLINTLTESVNYTLYYIYVTYDGIPQASVGDFDFTTIADAVAPVLSNFRIVDTDRNKAAFNSSKIITGTTFTGFTISGKTVLAITIVPNATTGHYFTVNSNFSFGDTPLISYVGGSNIKDTSVAQNALGTFSNTPISNQIVAAPAEPVVWTLRNNTTADDRDSVGDQLGADIAPVAIPNSGARSTKKVPLGSDAFIKWDWDTLSRHDAGGVRIGFLKASQNIATYEITDILVSADIRASNSNIDLQTNDVYKFTVGGANDPGYQYRFYVEAATKFIHFETSPTGVNWTRRYTFKDSMGANVQLATEDLYVACYFGVTGKKLFNVEIQASAGLV